MFSCVKILTNLYILFSQVRKLQPRREGDGAAMSDKAIRERQIVLGPMLGGELGFAWIATQSRNPIARRPGPAPRMPRDSALIRSALFEFEDEAGGGFVPTGDGRA